MTKKILSAMPPRCGKTLKTTIEKILQDMPYTYYYDSHKNLRNELVKLPSEKIPIKRNTHSENMGFRDDSAIQLPDFDKIEEIYLTYPNTLLADYLSYLV